MTTKPLLCIVTDRRRLAQSLGRPLGDSCELVLRQIAGAVAAGIDLVQIRERDLDARDLAQLVTGAAALARSSRTRVVVNDRLDVAMATGAAGVHLRESSVSARDLRRLAGDMLVGRSVHSAEAVVDAGPVDYFIAGTIFRSRSKSAAILPIGTAGLSDIVRVAVPKPVLAIGGIGAGTAREVAATGAAGIAAIGAFVPERNCDDVAAWVQEMAAALRIAFDRN